MKSQSYAEITMKSGAIVTFECVSLTWRRDAFKASLDWELPEGAKRRPLHIDLDEVVAVIFVDGTA